MRVAILGRTRMLIQIAERLALAGHEIAVVGTSRAAPEYDATDEDFKIFARDHRASYFCDPRINSDPIRQLLADSGAEIAISLNWISLIGSRVLELFTHGVINAHTGDLPRFRGNAAPNWAILVGESRVAVTLHRMVAELDAGPVLMKRFMRLEPDTRIGQIYQFLESNLPEMFETVLDGLQKGTLESPEQDSPPSEILRCYPRRPEDSMIDWTLPALEIDRLVRASSEPFGGAFTFHRDSKLIVWRCREEKLPFKWLGAPGQVAEVRRDRGEVLVLTGLEGLVLELVESAESGRVPAAELIRSNRDRLGMSYARMIELTLQESDR